MAVTLSSPDRPRLTVALVVRDAQPLLGETLTSATGLADELVVLDTGSNDYSRDLARRWTPKVFGFRWEDDFAAARNACLEHVTGDWVLWLDAGETIPQETAEGLRTWLADRPAPTVIGALFVAIPPAEPGGSVERAARQRLHPVRVDLRFQGRIGEQLIQPKTGPELRVESFPWTIWRGAREHDPQVKRARAIRNVRLAERAVAEAGPQPGLLNLLGEARLELDERDRAAALFRRGLDSSVRGSLEMLQAYYGLLTTLEGIDAARDAQLGLCLEALETFPFDAQLLCAMGSYLQAKDRPDLAARSFQAAYQFGQINPELWHLADLGETAAASFAIVLQMQGDDDQAARVLEEALARFPKSPRLQRRLLELCVERGDRDEAVACLDRLTLSGEERSRLVSAVQGACLAASRNWLAALAYLQTAYRAGCRDPLCLKWLSATLVELESWQEAAEIVGQWLRQEPKSAEAAHYVERLGQLGHSVAVEERAPSGQPTAGPRLSVQRIDPASQPAAAHRRASVPPVTVLPLTSQAGWSESPTSPHWHDERKG